MKKSILLFVISAFCFSNAFAQTATSPLYPKFPKLNPNVPSVNHSPQPQNTNILKPGTKSSSFKAIEKMEEAKHTDWNKYAHGSYGGERLLDTIYVGLVPHDTLVITGPFTHDGPIYVFNDGVLIFYYADVINTNGDLIAFQHGTVLGIGSDLTFPQNYFYQRSLMAVQNSILYFEDCNFNYSGVQHSLVVGDSAQVGMKNVHQMDWTTAGLFGAGSLWIHGMNLGGEYILTDSTTAYFNNVDTLLLWHKMPNTAVVNYAFPAGDTVMDYYFANTVPGVTGVNYEAGADSCHMVWWGLMPVNGSDVTISNSDIRAIGTWFEHGDTATVNGIFDNTLYANTVMPLSDRNLHMINTNVITWSLYVFDSSQIYVTNSAVGEVGTQQRSQVIGSDFLLDGSGGYFWATDTSTTYATNVMIYSTARSERYGTFLLQYSNMPFSAPSSVHNSLFISVQNSIPVDPVAYDASVMWLENIETPSTTHADSLVPVIGSAWIDQGPMGNVVDYGKYSLYYQLIGASAWTAIVVDSTQEIRHNALGVWNTTGLAPGNYYLRLVVYDNFNDSIEDYKMVVVQAAVPLGLNDAANTLSVSAYPNPAADQLSLYLSENNSVAEIRVYDALGQTKISTQTNNKQAQLDLEGLAPGVYFVETRMDNKCSRQRFIKK